MSRHPGSARFNLSFQTKLFLASAALASVVVAAILVSVRPTSNGGKPFVGKQIAQSADKAATGVEGTLAKTIRPFQGTDREELRGRRLGCPYDLNCQEGVTDTERPERYMPVPGGEADESDALNRLEEEWHNRLTYPTGIFNPAWIRQALAQDALIPDGIPAGILPNLNSATSGESIQSASSLSPTSFTSLGPQPLRMTGCSGCYNYSLTEGRVNDIAIDPVTTNVAYVATVGGGVWKTTTCCSTNTTWSVVTDDPLLSTISIDTITIDPNNHNTIYAGTGDLNYGNLAAPASGWSSSDSSGGGGSGTSGSTSSPTNTVTNMVFSVTYNPLLHTLSGQWKQ